MARKIAAVALAEAKKNNWYMAVAVVDPTELWSTTKKWQHSNRQRNDRVRHLATASKKLLQNFGATPREHAAVNFAPMVQLRVIQHLHH